MDKLKLLYVDDEEVNLSNFKMAMKRHFLVITACSAQEALTCFSNQEEIALVVADQKMPGMDGTELLAEIRNRYPDTVRIMLTAYSEPADIMAAINKGEVYHYLTKPWQEEILLDTLNKAAEKYRLTQQNKILLTQLTEKNEALQRELRTSRFLKDSLIRRDLILSAVNETSQKIISSAHWRHFTEPLIARLGLVMAVSKVHIYCLSQDASGNNRAQQEFEWASEAAVTADHACLPPSFSFAEIHLERWLCLLARGESIIDNTEDFPPREAALLQASHVHSLICTPIMVGRRCWGFLSLADCSTKRSWPALEIAAVKTAASLIAEAVHREEMDTELSVKQAQLTQAGRLTVIGEMAKGMAHEINLPMSLISLGADEIHQHFCKTQPDSPYNQTAKEISGQVVKVMRLLEDMRLFSTLSREKISDINLYWTINSALTFFREQFRAHLIQLHEETSEGVPSISTDNQKAEQILVTLLANARYAVMQKAAEIKKFPMQVWVRLYKEELNEEIKRKIKAPASQEGLTAVLILEVEDNGIGMSEETRQHCTDPFFTTKPRGEGTGLGLSVSKSLIQELGFHLEIESTLGEGSLFRLTIPTYAEYPVLLDNNEIQF
ncbi:MAG: response regulator [Desulfurivibrionaceae bacterium]|nr:response regulator [Desulfurivibrionaceae bacterium]